MGMNRRQKLITPTMILLAFLPAISVGAQSQGVKEAEDRLMKQSDENIERFRKGTATIGFVSSDGKAPLSGTVEIEQKTHDFLFGCIIFDLIRDENTYRRELFKERFKTLFNFAVFPFYWPGYEPRQGRPGWEAMTSTMEWCRANGITMKGHPLVWACHSGAPAWLAGYSEPETEELLKARVINAVRAFQGFVTFWDVVNEPVNVRTWKNKMAHLSGEDDWDKEEPIPAIADYVEASLRWAHGANPAANLIVNEYGTLAREKTRLRFDALLKELNARNAPISGVGIQAHEPRQEWFSPEEVWKTFDMFAKYRHPIHITEFHPQSSGVGITGGWRTGAWTPEAQAEFTEQFVRLCFGHPAIASINWWGLSDRNIWLPGGGLIDEEYRPKPVYRTLEKLINHDWKTRISMPLDGTGAVSFRGFFGAYEVTLKTVDGRVRIYPIHVRRDELNSWTFTVSY